MPPRSDDPRREMVDAVIDDRPLAPFARRSLSVTSVTPIGPYALMTCADHRGPMPRAGQFYMLATAHGWGGGDDERPYLPRALSVARASADGDAITLEFLVDAVGPGTRRLCYSMPGEQLLATGPFGNGFSPSPSGPHLLVGGGIGVAPLLILQDELLRAAPSPIEVGTLLGFRSADHAGAAALFAGAHVATDDGSIGRHGTAVDLLEAALDAAEPGATTVYSCGPPALLEAVRSSCERHGLNPQLALESGMACGFGACFGCVVPTRGGYVRLCLDGPVLRGGDLESALPPGAHAA